MWMEGPGLAWFSRMFSIQIFLLFSLNPFLLPRILPGALPTTTPTPHPATPHQLFSPSGVLSLTEISKFHENLKPKTAFSLPTPTHPLT